VSPYANMADDARDAARFRHLQKGLPLTVIVPTPTADKPNRKVTVIYGANSEPGWANALAQAVDAAAGVRGTSNDQQRGNDGR
jgi:hypothetical protein